MAIRPKLAVGRDDDPLEQEADRVADRVMRMPDPSVPVTAAPPQIRRKCAACEAMADDDPQSLPARKCEACGSTADDEPQMLRAKPADVAGVQPKAPAIVQTVLREPGRPLDAATRAFFEPRFGRDFSNIRVHTDAQAGASAKALNALAYTYGDHIAFAPGRFAPGSSSGRRLLAHEIAHVVQASGGSPAGAVRRQPEGKLLPWTPAPAAGAAAPQPAAPKSDASKSDTSKADASKATDPQGAPEGALTQSGKAPAGSAGGVQHMTFACKEKKLRIEAGSVATTYHLETCELPPGSYDPAVRIEGNDFFLDFPRTVRRDQRFDFTYRVDPGQPNPATQLAGQKTVHVDVVEQLPPVEKKPAPETPTEPACVVRLKDRQLVAPGSASRDLFKPLEFKKTVWSQPIPLGGFGFIEVNADAQAKLTGNMSGSYGRGMLTDICLTHEISSSGSSAPIKHPLIPPGSHTDSRTFAIGGRARFHLPASAHAGLQASGKLVISGAYLGVWDVAAIEGGVTARGDASLRGELDAMVEIVARYSQNSATFGMRGVPLELTISKSSFDKLDLAAQVALKGHASLAFGLDATAALRFAGFEIWRENWRLHKEAGLGLGWAGGIRYSPNPGIHWIPGVIGVLEGIDGLLDDDADDAEVQEDDLFDTLLGPKAGTVTAPDGLSPKTALPFIWHKPAEIYPPTLAIPNAEEPKSLSRAAGPTSVRYLQQGRSIHERIGVAQRNWPYVGKPFRYIPHPGDREEPEKTRLRNLLDTLGYDRSGTDVDHVYELQFGGADAFNNLWPADYSANRSAGGRHNAQLDNYRAQLGNIAGRHFVIARVEI